MMTGKASWEKTASVEPKAGEEAGENIAHNSSGEAGKGKDWEQRWVCKHSTMTST